MWASQWFCEWIVLTVPILQAFQRTPSWGADISSLTLSLNLWLRPPYDPTFFHSSVCTLHSAWKSLPFHSNDNSASFLQTLVSSPQPQTELYSFCFNYKMCFIYKLYSCYLKPLTHINSFFTPTPTLEKMKRQRHWRCHVLRTETCRRVPFSINPWMEGVKTLSVVLEDPLSSLSHFSHQVF